MAKKLAIIYAGGGAAGKTTTTKAFVQGEPSEYCEERIVETRIGNRPMKVSWTLYGDCAVAGNHHSGTDSNTGPGATKSAFFECLNDMEIAIVDGMISTPKWVTMCNEWQNEFSLYELGVLVLHFDLDAEELLTRLARRRGVDIESIRNTMWDKCVGLVKRANLLVNHFEDLCELPMTILCVWKEDCVDDIVELLDEQIDEYFNGGW